uniref:Peptidase A2 domain-containing protein n=1 Tax=Peronospora matthiolae TaxID=2874970 RepID=A0AAV1U7N1_9STRA
MLTSQVLKFCIASFFIVTPGRAIVSGLTLSVQYVSTIRLVKRLLEYGADESIVTEE